MGTEALHSIVLLNCQIHGYIYPLRLFSRAMQYAVVRN
jgi:hypothetical protein